MITFKDFNRFSKLTERKGMSVDNSLIAIANRLDDTGIIDIHALPCWCITVADRRSEHTPWCYKLRAGFKEFQDYIRTHAKEARQNVVVSDIDDRSLGRGEW